MTGWRGLNPQTGKWLRTNIPEAWCSQNGECSSVCGFRTEWAFVEIAFTISGAFVTLQFMLKKLFILSLLPVLLAGCAARITNLTPKQQSRNPDNFYPVEVSLACKQQTLRWDSIKPQIVVGNDYYPMHPTMLMSNRWEGAVPVPSGATVVRYRYKFEYLKNAFGPPLPDTFLSKEYSLKVR